MLTSFCLSNRIMSQLSNTDQHADPAIDNQAEDQLTLRALVTTKEAGVVIGKGK